MTAEPGSGTIPDMLLAQAIDPRDVLVTSPPVSPEPHLWVKPTATLLLLALALGLLFLLLKLEGAFRRWVLLAGVLGAFAVLFLGEAFGRPMLLDLIDLFLTGWIIVSSLGLLIGWAGGWLGKSSKTPCGQCGGTMTGNFCTNCGSARPQRAFPLS